MSDDPNAATLDNWHTEPLDGPHGWIAYCRFCGAPAWDDDHDRDCPVRRRDEEEAEEGQWATPRR